MKALRGPFRTSIVAKKRPRVMKPFCSKFIRVEMLGQILSLISVRFKKLILIWEFLKICQVLQNLMKIV